MTDEEIDILRLEIYEQSTIKDENEETEIINLDTAYKKELVSVLIENEKKRIFFQNTKNNVGISNTHRTSSKMCIIM